ncbi:MAG: hypothetical protein ACI936_003642, partial [Paraglaciecola sp.]
LMMRLFVKNTKVFDLLQVMLLDLNIPKKN